MIEELIKIQTEEEGYIALWKITSDTSLSNKNVLLTHGTFSNRKVLNAIAEYLTKNDFTCWIFEWRNHGSSSKLNDNFNFETVAKKDFKLVFDYLFDECQLNQIDCITHSGGGICLTIALIHYPQYQSKITSISFFGCQAFGAANSILNYTKILFGKYFGMLFGKLPATKIGGDENEKYHLMKQWFNWNLNRDFKGEDGTNYMEKMKTIKIPILSIFGAGDKFIAPPEGCKAYLSAFENELNQTLYCSKKNGFAENYNHSRLLHSRNASKEIYPKVLDWINENQGNLVYDTELETAEISQLKIEKGQLTDLEEIFEIYLNGKQELDSKGINQWTNNYPTLSIIENDLRKGDLHTLKFNDEIIGAISINENQDQEYQDIDWEFNDSKVLVVHRLVINPKHQRKGYAKMMMNFAENFAIENQYTSIRLDAYSLNKAVLVFYKKRNYFIRGNTYFPERSDPFYCMEKELTRK